MLISFIIPVYDSEKYLTQCLNSIFSQKFTDFECVVINDRSPGDCKNLVQDYVKERGVTIVYHENITNLGLGEARNVGVELSSGKYLFFLDSDDYLVEDGLSEAVIAMLGADLELLICNHQIYEPHNNLIKLPFPDIEQAFLTSKLSIPTYAWGKFFLREYWLKHNFSFESIYAEDLQLIPLVIRLAKSLQVSNQPICVYRTNFASLTHRFYSWQQMWYLLNSLHHKFVKHNLLDDESSVFLLSSFYNLTKVIGLGFHRYLFYKQFITLVNVIPQTEYFAEPLVNNSKRKKLQKIYASNGWYLFKPNMRYWKFIVTKIFR
ncbi:MAG: glycosyltransferase family 2 protein [Burkholderiales bacterium]|nr:glycosyltransferase family 2 protein [Burkholderiales bacterium]